MNLKSFKSLIIKLSSRMVFNDSAFVESSKNELEYWKNYMFSLLSAFILYAAVPLLFIGAITFYIQNYYIYAMVQMLFAFVLYITLTLKRIKINTRKIIVISTLYAYSTLLLLTTGAAGAGFVCIALTLLLAGCVFEEKQINELIIANLFIFIGISYFLFAGYFDKTLMAAYKKTWIICVLTTQTGGIALVYFVNSLNVGLLQQTKKVEEARKAAETAYEVKTRFLANMSHEIRTPLNGLMGIIQVLKETELTEEQSKLLKYAHTSSDALLAVINDILNYSKLEAGKIELERLPLNLREIIDDVLILFQSAIAEKSLKINVSFQTDMRDYYIGDPFRLKQILTNLIGNAVKFTEKGKIDIDVKILNEGISTPAFCLMKFSIKDTGIGIPSMKISGLFESFGQVDSSTTRVYGGTGLGLSICKGLVDLMNGEIQVESTEGLGSNFTFTCLLENFNVD